VLDGRGPVQLNVDDPGKNYGRRRHGLNIDKKNPSYLKNHNIFSEPVYETTSGN